jgi:hypothetical protein
MGEDLYFYQQKDAVKTASFSVAFPNAESGV